MLSKQDKTFSGKNNQNQHNNNKNNNIYGELDPIYVSTYENTILYQWKLIAITIMLKTLTLKTAAIVTTTTKATTTATTFCSNINSKYNTVLPTQDNVTNSDNDKQNESDREFPNIVVKNQYLIIKMTFNKEKKLPQH